MLTHIIQLSIYFTDINQPLKVLKNFSFISREMVW